MRLNFDDYSGFQPKIAPAQRYATQCTYLMQSQVNKRSQKYINGYFYPFMWYLVPTYKFYSTIGNADK